LEIVADRIAVLARNASAVRALARHAGWQNAARKATEQVWATRTYLGLRCDLERLPTRRPAAIPLAMAPRECATFEGLNEELPRTRGSDYLEVLLRRWSCETDIRELFVGDGPDGAPAYCQWLTRPGDQQRLHEHAPGRYPVLRADEVLLEGAYTFTAYRRKGVMADGMWQLLALAQEEGSHAAITYVADDNRASLRGCAAVGFELDHMRRNDRRIGFRRSVLLPVNAAATQDWQAATDGVHS
jgi:RimJ/RimL family protein N-acetyltransferase